MRVHFLDWDCTVKFAKYSNGRTAIQLYDAHDGSPIATASVNIVAVDKKLWSEFAITLAVDEEQLVCIKDYSENEGMLNALLESDIVEHTPINLPAGFSYVPLCVIHKEVLESVDS